MFHVSTMLNGEQVRRLIGNDIVVIIFQESTDPLDISNLDELGTGKKRKKNSLWYSSINIHNC